ncbi:fasciclin domain-containing protein [Gelidibacter japonicus]|uniref:fasciclin domain-containing protein n=1 Tax=Gelidibacter japonicus TaxID=1962232 RepID=UPI0013CFF08F|nr:fasciclin domain-containing protein [Gelidibacter japonicus]
MKEEARAHSIAGHVMMNKDLSTLAGAMQVTDLTTLLCDPGVYTVFSPTNQAFEKLPQKNLIINNAEK